LYQFKYFLAMFDQIERTNYVKQIYNLVYIKGRAEFTIKL
jgi:hypothetical protein